jgi:hypothetical protein
MVFKSSLEMLHATCKMIEQGVLLCYFVEDSHHEEVLSVNSAVARLVFIGTLDKYLYITSLIGAVL